MRELFDWLGSDVPSLCRWLIVLLSALSVAGCVAWWKGIAYSLELAAGDWRGWSHLARASLAQGEQASLLLAVCIVFVLALHLNGRARLCNRVRAPI
jgi:hypothetical protein